MEAYRGVFDKHSYETLAVNFILVVSLFLLFLIFTFFVVYFSSFIFLYIYKFLLLSLFERKFWIVAFSSPGIV